MRSTLKKSPRTTADAVRELGPWFHNLHLPDGTQTAPGHVLGDFPANLWSVLAPEFPADMRGLRVLDVGCNAGFYAVEMARRGAHVTAVDKDPRYLRQAAWAVRRFGVAGRVRLRRLHVYELARMPEAFDFVLFLGVFYHLRYPLLGLDLAARRTRGTLVFQSMTLPGEEIEEDTDRQGSPMERDDLLRPGWPRLAFLEHRFAGDRTNWWVPNTAAVQAMLRSTGLRIRKRVGSETYFCERDPELRSPVDTWAQDDLLAATGRRWKEMKKLPGSFFTRRSDAS